MAYLKGVDALRELISREDGTHITKISSGIPRLRNGLEYCFVEVSVGDKKQYGIQDYGENALELYHVALGLTSRHFSLVGMRKLLQNKTIRDKDEIVART
ncbi:MAG: hypothetical protein M3530_12185 [Thermoproteota archaeon]|nr:hypothetical protein [Thermoproteota archaeon]